MGTHVKKIEVAVCTLSTASGSSWPCHLVCMRKWKPQDTREDVMVPCDNKQPPFHSTVTKNSQVRQLDGLTIVHILLNRPWNCSGVLGLRKDEIAGPFLLGVSTTRGKRYLDGWLTVEKSVRPCRTHNHSMPRCHPQTLTLDSRSSQLLGRLLNPNCTTTVVCYPAWTLLRRT